MEFLRLSSRSSSQLTTLTVPIGDYRFISATSQRKGQDMASFAERMITAGLDDITLSGAGQVWVYDHNARTLKAVTSTITALRDSVCNPV